MTAFDILIIGGSGFVGSELVDVALKAGLNVAYTYSRDQLELPATSFQLQPVLQRHSRAVLSIALYLRPRVMNTYMR
jgi:nucleoside-diphosphate-sugar epimerase